MEGVLVLIVVDVAVAVDDGGGTAQENEIAQSRCAHGTDVMANYWLHNGFLQVEGRKMSKSDGNFVTIHELLETETLGGRKWPGEVLRLAMLMTHYREPIDFSVRRLEEAEATLEKWAGVTAGATLHHHGDREVISAIADDLNFSAAKVRLDQMSSAARLGDTAASDWLFSSLYHLGFERLSRFRTSGTKEAVFSAIYPDIDARITTRLALIAQKNWAEADRIRDELLAQGIQLKDGKDPVSGERVTTWEVKR